MNALRGAGGWIAAVLLAAVLAFKASGDFPYQFGVDFYQFWGVPVAHRQIDASPYNDPEGYARLLNSQADASANAKFKAANYFRRSLETMATPFFYSTFSWVPADYETAQTLYTALLYLAAFAAVFILARARGIAPAHAACLALLVDLTFNPFVQDVKYGNVTSFQLLYMAVMLGAALRGWPARNAWLEALYMGSLAVFVAFKPTTLWIALAFLAHYGLIRGPRRLAAGAAMAACAGLLAFALGAWFFHDPLAWLQWYRFTQGMNGGSLVRSLEQGNLSLPMMLAQRSMAYGLLTYSAMIAAWLAFAFVLAMTAMGRRTDLLLPTARRCLADPWLGVSIGVVFTLATSPLVWAYYDMFALVPMFALLRIDAPRLQRACVVLAYVLMANPLFALMDAVGIAQAIPLVMLWSWIPLLVAVVSEVARRRGEAEATLFTSAP